MIRLKTSSITGKTETPVNVSDPKCLQTPDYSVDVIAQCVRWYLAYSLSLLDLEDIDG